MKTYLHLPRLGLAVFALTASAPAVTLTISPTADAFVTSGAAAAGAGLPTANYGGAGALMVSAVGSAKGEMQTLFKFDFASVKASFDAGFGAGKWTVDDTTLELGTNFGTAGAQPNNMIFNRIVGGLFKVDWLVNDNWGEGTGNPGIPSIPANPPVDGVTFNSLDSLVSASDRTLGTFAYTPVGNTNPPSVPRASYVLGLDSSYLADLSAGNNVSLRLYAGDAGVGYLFNARTFVTPANLPVLNVSAVAKPVPDAGPGLAGVAGMVLVLAFFRREAVRGRTPALP